MSINRDNYEAFLLDYLEGNLPAEETAELMVFLEAHPDLKAELEDLDEAVLQPGDVAFGSMDHLKQAIAPVEGIDETNYEDYLAREVEGDLDDQEQQALVLFLAANPVVEKERAYFSHTKLDDEEVALPNKSLLIQEIVPTANIDEANYEDQLIARQEGLLTPAENRELDNFLELNPALVAESKYYHKVVLVPAAGLVYGDTSGLKKGAVIPLWQQPVRYWAAAASVAIIFFAWLTWPGEVDPRYGGPIAGNLGEVVPADFGLGEDLPDVNAPEQPMEGTASQLAEVDQEGGSDEPVVQPESHEATPSVRSTNSGAQVAEANPVTPDSEHRPENQIIPTLPANSPDEAMAQAQRSGGIKPELQTREIDEVLPPSTSPNTPDETELAAVTPKAKKRSRKNDTYTLGQFAMRKVKEKVFGKDDPRVDETKVSSAEMYEGAIVGFNKVFKDDVKVERVYSSDGEVSALKITDDKFRLNKKLGKKKA